MWSSSPSAWGDEITGQARGEEVDLAQEIEEGVLLPHSGSGTACPFSCAPRPAALSRTSCVWCSTTSPYSRRRASSGFQSPRRIRQPVLRHLGKGLDHVGSGIGEAVAHVAAFPWPAQAAAARPASSIMRAHVQGESARVLDEVLLDVSGGSILSMSSAIELNFLPKHFLDIVSCGVVIGPTSDRTRYRPRFVNRFADGDARCERHLWPYLAADGAWIVATLPDRGVLDRRSERHPSARAVRGRSTPVPIRTSTSCRARPPTSRAAGDVDGTKSELTRARSRGKAGGTIPPSAAAEQAR